VLESAQFKPESKTVNAERWQQSENIFQKALELEPHERAAFLVRICAGDASLLS
jgi:hypothetical protein